MFYDSLLGEIPSFGVIWKQMNGVGGFVLGGGHGRWKMEGWRDGGKVRERWRGR